MMFLGCTVTPVRAVPISAHLRQSVSDILQTPTGSRVMRRDYGSTPLALIDQPQTPALKLQIMSAIYGALLRREDRLDAQPAPAI
ncbi:hypothetical protein SODG_001876 [Sodalis praecaptivus]